MNYLTVNWYIFAFWQNSKILTGLLFILLAACGSLFRWSLQNSGKWKKTVGTLIANVFASFLLGILLADLHDGATITVIGTGFLGSFSTFSTVMMEVSDELDHHRRIPAILYLSASILGGVLAATAGLEIGGR